MAIVRVYEDESDGDYFPDVCMRCGEDADRWVDHTFTWMPSWVNFLILLGLGPWIIVALIMRKSMTITVPMCSRHANHWMIRTLYIVLGLLFWISVAIAAIVMFESIPKDLKEVVIGLCIFGPLIWLVIGVWLANTAIRPNEITNYKADLVNVSKGFAEEWLRICEEEDDRARPGLARRRRRPARPVKRRPEHDDDDREDD